jgi:hypothetical protein
VKWARPCQCEVARRAIFICRAWEEAAATAGRGGKRRQKLSEQREREWISSGGGGGIIPWGIRLGCSVIN